MTTKVTDEIDYKDDQGAYQHFDELSFSLTAPDGITGVATLSARVYFQTISREYVDFLKNENNTTSAGQTLATIYDATDQGPPLLVASADAPVDFGGEAGSGGTGGTGGGTAGTGGGGTGGTGAGGATGGGTSTGGAEAGSGGGDTTGGGGGCGCRTASDQTGALAPIAALLALGAFARRRARGSRG